MQKPSHPRALPWLTACYAIFMASFGGVIASLVLYQKHALHMSSNEAYGIFSAAMALLWILPLGGGYLSSKLGYGNTAKVGMLFCSAGMLSFCYYRPEAMYLGLSLFVVGNALATPAIWCMVDHCYSKTSVLRESGFTLFYLYFNLGVVIGIFLGGYIAEVLGFSYEFALNALFFLMAFVLFLFAEKKVTAHKGRTVLPQLKWSKKKIYFCLILAALLATPISMLLFQDVLVNNIIMVGFLIFMVLFLLRIAFQQKKRFDRNKLIAFVCLSLISVAFWTLYSLEPSFLTVFVQNNVNTHFLGINIPPSSFFAFDGIFVILIGLVLTRVWLYLSLKKKNPSLSTKFGGSLVVIGIGFCFLAMMVHFTGDQPMLARYIVMAYAIFSFGELLISPLGIAMVGNLAPEGWEGLMMGFWQLCIGIGGLAAGYIAMAPNLPDHAEALAKSNPLYFTVFLWVGLGGIIAGAVVFLFSKKIKHLMEEA